MLFRNVLMEVLHRKKLYVRLRTMAVYLIVVLQHNLFLSLIFFTIAFAVVEFTLLAGTGLST